MTLLAYFQDHIKSDIKFEEFADFSTNNVEIKQFVLSFEIFFDSML